MRYGHKGHARINDILERDYHLDLNDCDDSYGYVVNLLVDLIDHAECDGVDLAAAFKQAREISEARWHRAQSADSPQYDGLTVEGWGAVQTASCREE
jgi:hypothetical protein